MLVLHTCTYVKMLTEIISPCLLCCNPLALNAKSTFYATVAGLLMKWIRSPSTYFFTYFMVIGDVFDCLCEVNPTISYYLNWSCIFFSLCRRHLEHSTIIYEDPQHSPLLRLSWNKQDPNYLATFSLDALEVCLFADPIKFTQCIRC